MKIKKWLKYYNWALLDEARSYCAVVIYLFGKKPNSSTFIDEVSITAGYGQLNNIGEFKYALPDWCVRKMFNGCNNWDEYLKLNKMK